MSIQASRHVRRPSISAFLSTKYGPQRVCSRLRFPSRTYRQLLRPSLSRSVMRTGSLRNFYLAPGLYESQKKPGIYYIEDDDISTPFAEAVARVKYKTGSENSSGTIICSKHISVKVVNDETRGTILYVGINNAQKGNSLGRVLVDNLTQVFQTANKIEDLRCIVLRGELDPDTNKHPAFCSGANLNEMSALDSPKQAKEFISGLAELCSVVSACPVPTIAAIDGYCFGAGMELAACCDIRFATDVSKFAMPEIKVGIPSVIQARHLVDIMGWPNARYLMLFGRTIDGAEAERYGYINELFQSRERMNERIEEDIESLLESGPTAVRSQKLLLKRWKTMDVSTGIDVSVTAFADMWLDGGSEPKQYMAKALHNIKKRKSSK